MDTEIIQEIQHIKKDNSNIFIESILNVGFRHSGTFDIGDFMVMLGRIRKHNRYKLTKKLYRPISNIIGDPHGHTIWGTGKN